jgi:hypothetical protein
LNLIKPPNKVYSFPNHHKPMKTNLIINGSIIKLNIRFVKSSPKTVQHTITPKSLPKGKPKNFKLVTFSPTNFFTSPETFSHFHKQIFMGFPYKSSILIAQVFKIKKLKKAKTLTLVSNGCTAFNFPLSWPDNMAGTRFPVAGTDGRPRESDFRSKE